MGYYLTHTSIDNYQTFMNSLYGVEGEDFFDYLPVAQLNDKAQAMADLKKGKNIITSNILKGKLGLKQGDILRLKFGSEDGRLHDHRFCRNQPGHWPCRIYFRRQLQRRHGRGGLRHDLHQCGWRYGGIEEQYLARIEQRGDGHSNQELILRPLSPTKSSRYSMPSTVTAIWPCWSGSSASSITWWRASLNENAALPYTAAWG